jgi:NaMN:DMB phosphoribosyltransferase
MKPDSERAQRLHALVRQATGQKHDKALEAVAVGGAVLLGVAGLALAFAAGGKGKK